MNEPSRFQGWRTVKTGGRPNKFDIVRYTSACFFHTLPLVCPLEQDKLKVEAFSDPKVQGVTLYLSDFDRPVADKLLKGDIFSGEGTADLISLVNVQTMAATASNSAVHE